jgi:hypothetical protein
MSRNKALLIVMVASGVLTGCADYLNNYDTVTLAAGDTQKQNMLLQTADPFNPQSQDTAIETDGVRASDAVRKYQTSQAPGAAQPTNVTVNVGATGTQ